jgi:hypothetical protein
MVGKGQHTYLANDPGKNAPFRSFDTYIDDQLRCHHPTLNPITFLLKSLKLIVGELSKHHRNKVFQVVTPVARGNSVVFADFHACFNSVTALKIFCVLSGIRYLRASGFLATI